MSKTIAFKHSGNTGDIIYALAGIKAVCEKYEAKAILYIWLDRPGFYYEGAKHPLGEVIMNKHMFDMLAPLLLAQSYIEDVLVYEGQKITVDLDLIRQNFVNMPYGHIARWYFYQFPDMATDLGKPWLDTHSVIPDYLKEEIGEFTIRESIVINRTSRYRNPYISYAFIRKYAKRLETELLFVGVEEEFKSMQRDIPNIKMINCRDFFELVWLIKNCKLFIGNQSMCFGIAEASKAPRILEVCKFAPNVIPQGDGPAYDFYTQHAFEFYVEEMMKVN